MLRSQVTVRDAVPDDLPDLVALWGEIRDLVGGTRADLPAPGDEAVLRLLASAGDESETSVRLGVVDDLVAGVVVTVRERGSLFDEGSTLRIACLHVRKGIRRRGVGHALLADVAEQAQRLGAAHVASSVPARQRDVQRFYARAGFGPQDVRRVASVPVLRRALGAGGAGTAAAGERTPGGRGSGVLEGVLARRRALRGRGEPDAQGSAGLAGAASTD